jgi:hypothetical protein
LSLVLLFGPYRVAGWIQALGAERLVAFPRSLGTGLLAVGQSVA